MSFTTARSVASILSARSMATGSIRPRALPCGLSSVLIANSVSTITVVADPISIA